MHCAVVYASQCVTLGAHSLRVGLAYLGLHFDAALPAQGPCAAVHWTATVEKELYRWFIRLVDCWRLGWAS
jgi:hypothetical protein